VTQQIFRGPEHVKAFEADTKLLVKLLDASKQLPSHAHLHAMWVRVISELPLGNKKPGKKMIPGEQQYTDSIRVNPPETDRSSAASSQPVKSSLACGELPLWCRIKTSCHARTDA
jgi:hypothetical protein